jgi:2-oxoisovalerate dehydrogenase E1 component
MDLKKAYEKMVRIRAFEENLLALFSQNKLFGTTHTYLGQEAVAVAAMEHLGEGDCVFSNHRCHGHFLAYSGRADLLLAEIMGKEAGMCRGRGGSQHICWKNFYTNGIQGGIVPNATGMALAEKYKKTGAVTMVFLGDGTLGQGVVYESFNMASLWQIPVLYVVEDNGYAMTTRTRDGVAGSIPARARAFAIETEEITSNDVEELDAAFGTAFDYLRREGRPYCLVIHTYRLGPHSKGDDFREESELEEHRKSDPLLLAEAKMDPQEAEEIRRRVGEEIRRITQECSALPGEPVPELEDLPYTPPGGPWESLLNRRPRTKCVTAINRGLRRLLEKDQGAVILGEDIGDPYGGSFKATRGLSLDFPDRVWNTPISEAGFIGLGVGMALRGLHPVVDLMFGDFITLGFDQILNHAVKYHWMYAGKVRVPLLIRAPMGGGRGYGATHSQTLEKYFTGIPGLRVAAVSPLHDPEKLLERLHDTLDRPTLLVENKALYGKNLLEVGEGRWGGFFVEETGSALPVIRLSYDPQGAPDLVVVTYGAMAETALGAAARLMVEEEIMADVLVLTQISPLPWEEMEPFLRQSPRVVTLEEGTVRGGWGSEVTACCCQDFPGKEYLRIGARNCPLPTNVELERLILPSEESVYTRIKEWMAE